MAAIYAPIVTETAISFEEEPPAADEIAKRMASSHLWLVAQVGAGVMAYAYATHLHPREAYRWSCEISVYVAEAARGRGMGRQLIRDLLQQLEVRGFVNAFAGIALPNDVSVALFASFGFRKIAHWHQVGFKLGKWHDVSWWQLQLRKPTTPPPVLYAGNHEVWRTRIESR